MTFGLWLFLFSFAVAILPHLSILKKFEKEKDYPVGKDSYWTFQIADSVWNMVCIFFFGWRMANASNSSESFAFFAIFLCLVTIPTATYASFTGVYSAGTRYGFYYYRKYKNPAKQFRMSSKLPELKIVGLIQIILLTIIAGVSMIYIFR